MKTRAALQTITFLREIIELLIKMREASAAIVTLALMSCATVDNIKTEVMERLPKKQSEQVTQGDTPESSSDASSPLSGEEQLVMSIQENLMSLGYSTGPANGRLGAKTEAAIQDFQLDSGLRIDGKASEKLLELIKEKMASS